MPQVGIEARLLYPRPVGSRVVVSTIPDHWAAIDTGSRTFFLGEYKMLSIFRGVMKNNHGVTAIEYTLIASLIAVAAIVAMRNVGTKVSDVMSNVASTMG